MTVQFNVSSPHVQLSRRGAGVHSLLLNRDSFYIYTLQTPDTLQIDRWTSDTPVGEHYVYMRVLFLFAEVKSEKVF